MKQLLQNLRSGETAVTEVPIPHPKPGTALVQTAASLVSAGTERTLVEFSGKSLLGKARSRPDLVRQVLDKARREGLFPTVEAAFNRLDQPSPLGYSSAGTIVAVGPGLQGFRVGDRVACAGGNYAVHAEYEIVPQNLMTLLPPGVDFESGAFTTLGAIALHGFRLAQPQVGERIAVIGLGLLGLLTVEIAKAAGCAVFGVDLNPARVDLARQLGAEAVLRGDAEAAVKTFSRGRGCDAILITADARTNDPIVLASALARDRARVVAVGAVGLSVPRKPYYEKELNVIVSRSYGPGRYDPNYEEAGHDYPVGYVRWSEGRNLEAVVDLLASKRLDVHPLITHRFPIDEAPQAYELITGKLGEPFLGVLLTYSQAEAATQPEAEPPVHPAAHLTVPTPDLRLGVIGAGNYASAVFLPAIRQVGGIHRSGVASGTGLSAQTASQRFGFDYAASSSEQILDDPAINVIAILTRHNQHASQVLAALRSDKHVFCEKPLAIHPEELDEIAAALHKESTPLLMVGFNRRFAPMAQQLKQFLGHSGEPLVVNYRINAGPLPLTHWTQDPEVGGGRIIGEGCHFIDFLSFLIGELPVSVSAQALPDQNQYREDNVVIHLAYPNGSIGTVTYLANGDKAFAKERVEVFCGGQVGVLDDFRTLELVQGGRRQVVHSWLRQDKGHRAGWAAFLNAIRAGGPAPIPYDQLIGVTRASFAAVEALRCGEKIQL